MNTRNPSDHPEQNSAPELENINTIDELIDYLGFREALDLDFLHTLIVDAYKENKQYASTLMQQYQITAEQLLNKLPDEESDRTRLGYMLTVARIRRDGEQNELYIESLEDSLVYAINMGAEKSADIITDALDAAGQQ